MAATLRTSNGSRKFTFSNSDIALSNSRVCKEPAQFVTEVTDLPAETTARVMGGNLKELIGV